MPNQRQPGTKLAGAYISTNKDKALAEIAAQKGYANKAEFIRFLFDEAIAEKAALLRNTAKPKNLCSVVEDQPQLLPILSGDFGHESDVSDMEESTL